MIAIQTSEDGNTVANIIMLPDGADPSEFGAIMAPNAGIGIGWTKVNDIWSPPSVPVTLDQIKQGLNDAVDALVQSVARDKGYNSAEACASYVTSTNATWSAEAKSFIAWRDAVWIMASAVVNDATVKKYPTASVLIAGLPAIGWPQS